ncbi:MAG: hypothetical protein MHM6MM_008264 [Cercozoa sp. M6MM]
MMSASTRQRQRQRVRTVTESVTLAHSLFVLVFGTWLLCCSALRLPEWSFRDFLSQPASDFDSTGAWRLLFGASAAFYCIDAALRVRLLLETNRLRLAQYVVHHAACATPLLAVLLDDRGRDCALVLFGFIVGESTNPYKQWHLLKPRRKTTDSTWLQVYVTSFLLVRCFLVQYVNLFVAPLSQLSTTLPSCLVLLLISGITIWEFMTRSAPTTPKRTKKRARPK